MSTDRAINLDPVAVLADDVTTCQRCWAMVPREYAEAHMAWHHGVDGWIERYEEAAEERAAREARAERALEAVAERRLERDRMEREG